MKVGETDMLHAIRERATVKPGGVVELRHPELPAGAQVDVVIMLETSQPVTAPPPLTSLIGQGSGCFTAAADIDDFLLAERDAWDR